MRFIQDMDNCSRLSYKTHIQHLPVCKDHEKMLVDIMHREGKYWGVPMVNDNAVYTELHPDLTPKSCGREKLQSCSKTMQTSNQP